MCRMNQVRVRATERGAESPSRGCGTPASAASAPLDGFEHPATLRGRQVLVRPLPRALSALTHSPAQVGQLLVSTKASSGVRLAQPSGTVSQTKPGHLRSGLAATMRRSPRADARRRAPDHPLKPPTPHALAAVAVHVGELDTRIPETHPHRRRRDGLGRLVTGGVAAAQPDPAIRVIVAQHVHAAIQVRGSVRSKLRSSAIGSGAMAGGA